MQRIKLKNHARNWLVLLALGCVLFATLPLNAQTTSLSGKVTDEKKEPLYGVTVRVKETNKGTSTNIDGGFSLNVASGQTLIFSYIGFKTQEIKWNGKKSLNIILKEDTEFLNEVVVVGYGSQKKVNLTGAVSQVDGEILDNRPLPSLTRGLQGVIPNLNIRIVDGTPTRSATFNVRGTTSIGAGGSALVLIDGIEGDPNMINPNDIESISVLKDASSAAIYGSRAAFGVVLITTKNAKNGKIDVTLSSNISLNQRTVTPKLVTDGYQWAKNFSDAFSAWNDYKSFPISVNNIYPFSREYLDALKRHSEDPSLPEVEYNEETQRYWYFGNTDWYKIINKKNILSTEQAISVSGASDKVKAFASGRYYFQDGIFNYNSDQFHKYNLRLKGDIKINKWLSLGENIDYNEYSYKFPMFSDGDNSIWRQFEHQGYPMAVIYNPDGTYTHTAVYTGVAAYMEKLNEAKEFSNQMRSTTSLTAKFFNDALKFKADFTYQRRQYHETRNNNYIDYSTAPDKISRFGRSLLRQYSNYRIYRGFNLTGEYNKVWNDAHDFSILAGYNVEEQNYRVFNASRDGILQIDKPDFNLMDGLNYGITGGGNDWAFLGLFYRLAYSYKGKYLFETNGRYDGSSKFPKNQRFGFFPSVSAGWRISEEPFLASSKNWLDNLKLRTSYGSLGNGNIAPYRYLETMSTGKTSVILEGVQKTYTSMPGVIPDGLTWETVNTFDIGVDANMFKNRFQFIFDWYLRNTLDMFTPSNPLPNVFGQTVPYGNYADMKTQGWELGIAWKDNFNLAEKPFEYNISANLWDSRSFITRFNNKHKLLNSRYVGQEIGEIWGYETLGFFTSEEDIKNHANQDFIQNSNNRQWLPGDLKFADLNGDKVINSGSNTVNDPGDRKIIGNNSPRYQFGINLGAKWNGIGLTMFFQGVGKRDWYFDKEAGLFYGPYNRPYGYQPTYLINNHWTEENPNAYFPRFRGYTALGTGRSLGAPQTRYLQDASYIRLKNVTLDYTLPTSFCQALNLKRVQIYLTGNNIFTWSNLFKHAENFDPEVIESPKNDMSNRGGQGYAYPMLKSYTLGLNITF